MGVVKLDFISNYIFTDTNFNAAENYIYFRTTVLSNHVYTEILSDYLI